MIFENQSKLNTLNSFIEDGFKIERDGKVITLSQEEMRNFRYLDKAYDGRCILECGIAADKKNKFAEKYLEDETVCFKLADTYYDSISSGDVEKEVACQFIDELAKNESSLEDNSLKSKIACAKASADSRNNEEKMPDKEVDFDRNVR